MQFFWLIQPEKREHKAPSRFKIQSLFRFFIAIFSILSLLLSLTPPISVIAQTQPGAAESRGLNLFPPFLKPRAQGIIALPAQMNTNFTPNTIAAGGVSTLAVNIYNPNSFALILSNTPNAWSDPLPAGVTFTSPVVTHSTCGGTVVAVGNTLSLIGGIVPAQAGSTPGTCSVTASVTSTVSGNHDFLIPASNLHATDPTGTVAVTNDTDAKNTLFVNSLQPPSLSKSFNGNTVWVGQTSILSINIRNNDPNYPLTNVSLTDALPANVKIASSPLPGGWSTNCGSPVVHGPGGGALAPGDTSVVILSATVAKASTCTIQVNVVSDIEGVYSNTIPAGAIQNDQAVTNSAAAQAPLNVQRAGATKSFSPASFQQGGQSTMTITLRNPGDAMTDIQFIDTLPAGLSVVSAGDSQCGGTVSFSSGPITFTGGSLPAGSIVSPSSCSITATVTSSTPGNYTNTLPVGGITYTQNGHTYSNVLAASANVNVYTTGEGMPGGGSDSRKAFSPSAIPVGGTSRLTIYLRAPADTNLTGLTITDSLPSSVVVASIPNPATSGCGSPVFNPMAGSSLLTLTGGTIDQAGICSISVNVVGTALGIFTNTITPANITNDQVRNLSANLTATLSVSGLTVAKSFYPPVVNINGVSTLTITLTNTNTSPVLSTTLQDNLPSGVSIASTPNLSTTCLNANITNSGGNPLSKDDTTIKMSDATLPAQVGSIAGICTINVDVVATEDTRKTNTIAAGAVTGNIQASGLLIRNLYSASANLDVTQLSIDVVKSFSPLTVYAGSVSTMTVTLNNPNSATLTGITFTDNLPQSIVPGKGMMIANPPNGSIGGCGGSIQAVAGDTSFIFSGGSLPANGNCLLTVNVVMNVNGNLINTIAAGAVTASNGATNSQPASATLTNLPGVSITKVFSSNPIQAGVGNSSILNFTLQNTSGVDLSGLGFTDTLPDGVTVSPPINASQCGGSVSYLTDPFTHRDTIRLQGGALAKDGSCTLQVPVTAPLMGSYLNCVPANNVVTDQHTSNGNATCDTLVVNNDFQPPRIQKSFTAASIPAGTTSVLKFTITNPTANNVALTGIAFTDTLPANVTLSGPPNVSQCGGTVMTSTDPSTHLDTITFSGGQVGTSPRTCDIVVAVTSTIGGIYLNTTSAVTSTNGGTGNSWSATLTVVEPPAISKSFSPNSINTGGTSTLTFTITNPANNTVDLTGVAFTDTLPSGVAISGSPATPQCGGMVTSTATSVSLSGGTILVSGTCTVTVDVTSAFGGTYLNTSGAVTSTNGGPGNTASDTLTVIGSGLTLAKTTSTACYTAAGQTVQYSYLITNTGNTTLTQTDLTRYLWIQDNKFPSPTDVNINCPQTALDPGQSMICTADYTTTAPDVTARSVSNTATASGRIQFTLQNATSLPSSTTVYVPSLTLSKTTSTNSFLNLPAQISYTYTLTNTGLIPLYGPFTVTDDKAGSVSCGDASTSIAPGANLSCSKNYSLIQADVDNGYVTNTASATGYCSSGSTLPVVNSNPDSVKVYRMFPPSIVKEFSPDTIAVGDTSTLTFTITNPNAVSLTGVRFSDTFPNGVIVANPPAANQCGGTVTYSNNSISLTGGSIVPNSACTVTVSVTSGSGGTYVNTSGNVNSTNGGQGNTATDTLYVNAPPKIHKTFTPAAIHAGETSTLTLTLSNPSGNPNPLTGVAFTDAFPTGLTVANPLHETTTTCGNPNFSPKAGDTSLTFSGGDIGVNATCTITVDVTAPTGTYPNTTGAVSSTNGGTGVPSNTATLVVNDILDLSITKDDGQLAVSRGDTETYTIVVTNHGPGDAIGATVFDALPSTLNAATWTCTAEPGASCSASGSGNISDTVNIPSGSSISYSLTATVSNSATTSISNTASVNPPIGVVDSNPANNSATDVNTLNLLTIQKTADPVVYYSTGTIIHYSYTVRNAGTSVMIQPFSVTDDKISPLNCVYPASLAHGETFTCTATHTISQTDVDNKFLTNTVQATGIDPDGVTISSNTDSATVNSVKLTLAKSITSGDPYTALGNVIDYSYLLTNTGNVTLTGPFSVTDDKVTVTCPPTPSSLVPTESTTCIASHTITPADLEAGHITNTATAHANYGNTVVDSNPDSQTAYGLVITVTKDDGVTQTVPGATLVYEIVVRNAGGADLSGVTITDTLPAVLESPAIPSPIVRSDGLPAPTFSFTGNSLHIPSSGGFDLPMGVSVTFKLQAQVSNSAAIPSTITNTVIAQDDGSKTGGTPVQGQDSDTNEVRGMGKVLIAMSQHETIAPSDTYIGEVLTYTTRVEVAPGANLENLHLVDSMDTGMAIVGCNAITVSPNSGFVPDPARPLASVCANFTASPLNTPDQPGDARNVDFDFGTVRNTGNADEIITVEYTAVVLNTVANVRGTQLDNSANWVWKGSTPGLSQKAGPVTIVEPTLTIKKTVDNSHPLPGHVVTFTITIANDGPGTNSDAFDVVINDRVPNGLTYVPDSLVFGGFMPTSWSDLGAPLLTATWDTLPIGASATVTFQATVHLNRGGGVTNTASVEWTSLPGDFSNPQSPYNSYSTERYYDPNDPVNVYGTSSSARVQVPALPDTGFVPGRVTVLPGQPLSKKYDSLENLRLQIPSLGLYVPIVGVPAGDDGWDLTWLNNEAGYLEGTAYPTWNGNTGITGHVYDADGNPGPFVNLGNLKWDDQVIIESNGQKYIYEVRENIKTWEGDLSVLKHEDTPWLTLLTCQGYNPETGKYIWRRAVRAALVRVE
jgi:LPXTG-site transpeptidase (sortase) family protein